MANSITHKDITFHVGDTVRVHQTITEGDKSRIQIFEGVGIALGALRSNKMRAALTVLGVAIGVMVVMVIAAMITGINRNEGRSIEDIRSGQYL